MIVIWGWVQELNWTSIPTSVVSYYSNFLQTANPPRDIENKRVYDTRGPAIRPIKNQIISQHLLSLHNWITFTSESPKSKEAFYILHHAE